MDCRRRLALQSYHCAAEIETAFDADLSPPQRQLHALFIGDNGTLDAATDGNARSGPCVSSFNILHTLKVPHCASEVGLRDTDQQTGFDASDLQLI
jgi:hypothetical protein